MRIGFVTLTVAGPFRICTGFPWPKVLLKQNSLKTWIIITQNDAVRTRPLPFQTEADGNPGAYPPRVIEPPGAYRLQRRLVQTGMTAPVLDHRVDDTPRFDGDEDRQFPLLTAPAGEKRVLRRRLGENFQRPHIHRPRPAGRPCRRPHTGARRAAGAASGSARRGNTTPNNRRNLSIRLLHRRRGNGIGPAHTLRLGNRRLGLRLAFGSDTGFQGWLLRLGLGPWRLRPPLGGGGWRGGPGIRPVSRQAAYVGAGPAHNARRTDQGELQSRTGLRGPPPCGKEKKRGVEGQAENDGQSPSTQKTGAHGTPP